MTDKLDQAVSHRRAAAELLLRLLCTAGLPPWPGADGLTVQDILQMYPQAAAAGRVPTPRALLALYPHLAEALRHLLLTFASGVEPPVDREG